MPVNIGGGILSSGWRSSELDSTHKHLLVGHWDFADRACYTPGDDVAYDMSNASSGRRAFIEGSPTYVRSPGYFDITGDTTYIRIVDINSQYTVPRGDALEPFSGSFAFGMWVKFDALDTLDTLFELGSWTDTLLVRYSTSSGGLDIYAESAHIGTFPWTPSTGVWYNVVVTRQKDSGTWYLMVNGSENATTLSSSVSIDVADTEEVYLMRSKHTTNQFTNGQVAMFSVWRKFMGNDESNSYYISHKKRFGYT